MNNIFSAWTTTEDGKYVLRRMYGIKTPTGQMYAFSLDKEDLEAYRRLLIRTTIPGWEIVELEIKE